MIAHYISTFSIPKDTERDLSAVPSSYADVNAVVILTSFGINVHWNIATFLE